MKENGKLKKIVKTEKIGKKKKIASTYGPSESFVVDDEMKRLEVFSRPDYTNRNRGKQIQQMYDQIANVDEPLVNNPKPLFSK